MPRSARRRVALGIIEAGALERLGTLLPERLEECTVGDAELAPLREAEDEHA